MFCRTYDTAITAANFLRLAAEQGLVTSSQLAQHFNVSFTTVANWRRGVKAPSIDKIVEFCGEFGYSYDEVIGSHEYEW